MLGCRVLFRWNHHAVDALHNYAPPTSTTMATITKGLKYRDKGRLQQELASIYYYYLHPEDCPQGILV